MSRNLSICEFYRTCTHTKYSIVRYVYNLFACTIPIHLIADTSRAPTLKTQEKNRETLCSTNFKIVNYNLHFLQLCKQF
jgi:hypothetical protein